MLNFGIALHGLELTKKYSVALGAKHMVTHDVSPLLGARVCLFYVKGSSKILWVYVTIMK